MKKGKTRLYFTDLKFSKDIFSCGRSFQAKRTAIWKVVTSRSNFPILLANVILKRRIQCLNKTKSISYKMFLSPVQTDATLLDVTCCFRLHTLLHVAACCWELLRKVESGETFDPTTPNTSFVLWSPKRSATMLGRFAQLFQHCWGHAHELHIVSLNIDHVCHNIVARILIME